MILYAAADLIWASKIKASADALGLSARPVRTPEMLAARLADTPGGPSALLVDMDKGDDALVLIRQARAALPGLAIVAFGPHVAKELLQSAREAGATDVLTRGALEHNLEDVLMKLAGS